MKWWVGGQFLTLLNFKALCDSFIPSPEEAQGGDKEDVVFEVQGELLINKELSVYFVLWYVHRE